MNKSLSAQAHKRIKGSTLLRAYYHFIFKYIGVNEQRYQWLINCPEEIILEWVEWYKDHNDLPSDKREQLIKSYLSAFTISQKKG